MNDYSDWLSLSEAAKLLGVHYTTLRRWTNQGLIDHIRTPGGRRKFTRKAIDDFLNLHRPHASDAHAIQAIGSTLVTRTREEFLTSDIVEQTWYLQMSEGQRLSLRKSGNRLVALLFQYCARNVNGEVFLEEGIVIAREYGRFCYSVGMTLEECVRTFLFFRRSMLYAIHETGTLQTIGDMSTHHIFERMVYFLDEFIVNMVAEYENASFHSHSIR
jgi:excisionase family DNA binding protein